MVWSVHYLRGIAALLVVLYHTRSYINDVYAESKLGDLMFGQGYFGVDLFFMISGFVIVLSTKNEKSKISFILKRFFRIYPLYIVSLIFLVIISMYDKTVSVSDILKSMFFLHLDYSKSAPFYGYSINHPAWTLTYELMFYSLFFIGLSISHKYRAFICSMLIIAFYLIINFNFGHNDFNAYASVNYSGFYSPIIKLLSSPMMVEFIIGMMLFYIFNYLNKNALILKNNSVHVINSIFFIFSILLIVSPINQGHGILNIGIGCFLLMLTSIIYEVSGRLIKINILSFLGDISYSLYISHILTIKIITSNLIVFSYIKQLSGFSLLLAVVLCTILFAFILHKTVEIPLAKIGKRLLNRKNTASTF